MPGAVIILLTRKNTAKTKIKTVADETDSQIKNRDIVFKLTWIE